ncbi:TonB-dependent siderophore receptor [Sphingomonas lycopersici]|uniref:TonB-dependent receptor n=1 Tax=Sphingomonas lycopersici TaxID=2951807 RepID=A0AA41ZFQ6_9SPHN|nr:TonB-dependent receptor [Sphingomonas lycopersici]MCW6534853.1 TonB-dependent receptor [Sphingomonas lycopersici]
MKVSGQKVGGLLAASALVALASPALAQTQTQTQGAAAPADTGGDIVVSGYRYLSEDTSGTTGLPLPIEEVPQSISLVSQDFLKAADLKSLGEIAQYSPGALFAGNQEGFGSIVKLRGFTAGSAVDGLTVGSLDFDPDYATIDRMEIVKGPSSVVYGAASPGGLINLVTKAARANTPSYVEALGGSWGRWRLEGQVAGALNSSGSIRAIGVAAHEEANSFMTDVRSRKTVLYGGVDADIASGLTGYIHAAYERYRRTAFDGIPTLPDGTPAPVDRSFFIGARDFVLTTTVKRVSAGLDWKVSSAWSVSLKTNFQDANTHGPAAYGFDLMPNGDFSYSIQNLLKNDKRDFSIGASSILKLDGVGMADSFLSASAIYHETSLTAVGSTPQIDGSDTGTANIFDGVKAIEATIASAAFPGPIYNYGQRLKYLTLSGQAVLKVTPWATVLGGLSWSKPDNSTRLDSPWQDFSGNSKMSYRAALTVEPVTGVNLYGSYSESFQPQLRIDVAGRILQPLTGRQYELGAKYVSPDRRLLLTAALFDITQANQALFDEIGPDGTDRYRALGETRHRGLELEAIGRITGSWQVNAGFTLLDAKIRKDDDPTVIGKAETYLPRTTASLYTSYDFNFGLFLGAGVRFVDAVKTSFDGSTRELPSYTLVDASAGYNLGKWRLQLNLKNIFDKHYYINNYQTLFYGNVVGEPRSFTLSLRRTF